MDFTLSAEQEELRATVGALMARWAPDDYLRQLDDEHRYPYELYEQWVAMGLPSLPFPESVGGAGGTVFDMVLVAEEIGRKGYDLVGVYGTPLFNALNVAEHGTERQRAELLPRYFAGELRFSISITEPGAGSDAGAIATTAQRRGDGWVLNGEKVFASGAGVDNTLICIYCRTEPAASHRDGLTCFLLDNGTPGLDIRPMQTLGRHMFPTTQLFLDDVFVADDAVLGPVNGGWGVMLGSLQLERLVASAAYVGNAAAVVDEALAYAKQREQFGRPIGDFQVIAHMLADMATEVEAARLLTYHTAWRMQQGVDALTEVCMSKLFGSEMFLRVANHGMQILGGYGYSMETPMQRHFRAARGATITAGTSQMQRDTIARRMGLRPR